jgi:hypothetical protein
MVKLEVVSTVADIHYGSLWIIMDHYYYVSLCINGIQYVAIMDHWGITIIEPVQVATDFFKTKTP